MLNLVQKSEEAKQLVYGVFADVLSRFSQSTEPVKPVEEAMDYQVSLSRNLVRNNPDSDNMRPIA